MAQVKFLSGGVGVREHPLAPWKVFISEEKAKEVMEQAAAECAKDIQSKHFVDLLKLGVAVHREETAAFAKGLRAILEIHANCDGTGPCDIKDDLKKLLSEVEGA